MASAKDFERSLSTAVRGHDADALVVDLTNVSFIDSSGVSALVRTLERQRWAGGALAIVATDTRVTTIFEISGLDRLLRLYSSCEEAIDGVTGR